MKFGTVDIPNSLLDDLHNNKVVVFAGAGVSMGEPACLPNFEALTEIIARGTGEAKRESENLEQFLGRLLDRRVQVHDIAKSVLSREGLVPAPLHGNLLKLFRRDQSIRLITTNFDLLFECAAEHTYDNTPEVFHAPLLPFRDQLNGIVHIHGSVSYPDHMVLTDRDFGRAYLREASVTHFLLDLYDKYTFLFVGYSHNDTVMNYLVRSLPPKADSSHYALIADSSDVDHQHWGSLEIEMILYPQHANDHSQLNEAIGKLADHVQRGMVGWQREISVIAEKYPHELNQEEEGIIDYALRDNTMSEFFTRSASHPEWIEWLDERGHLARLVGSGQLRESDKIISWWLTSFVFKHAYSLFLPISNHNTRIHPTFWNHIAQTIGSDNEPSLDTTILSRWISLLLSTAPEEGETPDGSYVSTSNCLTSIARRCIPHRMIKELLLIFDAMIQSRFSIIKNPYIPRDVTERDLQISVELPLVGEYNELNELWKNGLKPNLSKISKPLLERVIWCLENQYFFQHTWGRATRLLEHASQMRSAIEPHEQNVGSHDIDIVIDVARYCLDWLATHEPAAAGQWCNRLVDSDPPLLRRLAVHSLTKREDLISEEKLPWLLEHTDLHDYAIHHEIYQAVRHAYPGADSNSRKALIERVRSYRFPHTEHPDNEEITAREHFDWFHWLHDAYPDCLFAEQAMKDVLAEYPHFESRTHPDFTSWIQPGNADVGIPRFLTSETLLANRPADLLDELLSSEDDE